MVRLLNNNNVKYIAKLVSGILWIQEYLTHYVNHNYPKEKSCIFALWHANQCSIYGIVDKAHCSVLISNSKDGEIIDRAVRRMGFRTARGSSERKGAIEATMQLISRLNDGESVAIMIDGPHGPLHKVKNGVIKLAQKTGKPIVPLHWYSAMSSFITLPSWDKMKYPLGHCDVLNMYGEPIYIKEDATDEEINAAKAEIKRQLDDMEAKAPQLYNEAKKNKLWKK